MLVGRVLVALAPHMSACALLVPMATRTAGVVMVERRASEFEKIGEMPEQLEAWGCTHELWDALRSKGRSDLKRLARSGREELARARMEKMKATMLQGASTEPTRWFRPAGVDTAEPTVTTPVLEDVMEEPELYSEARRAAEYLCAGDEECAADVAAELVATAHSEEQKLVEAEDALKEALELALDVEPAASKNEALASMDPVPVPVPTPVPAPVPAADAARLDAEAAEAPSGFEWGGTF